MADRNIETDKELEEVLNSHKTKIRIVGTGGGGNNTVTRLVEVGIKGVDIIAINTDAQDLLYGKADEKILIGRNITNGLGAGSDPLRGEESARESIKEIEAVLTGSDMVFVTCGLGGGTGTGSAPIVAEAARKIGAVTIAIVTLPFQDEGTVRWENASRGLEELQQKVDTVIVVQNDRLLDLVPDLSLSEAFKVADEILVNAVKGITELVTEKGLVNLDFADIRTIMQDGGLAMIGLGETESEQNAAEAAEKALQNPLLDVDIAGAKSALINITGGRELSLKSSKTIMRIIADRLDPSARIIWGARLDESMADSLRVMLIVTSLRHTARAATELKPSSEGSQPAVDQETKSRDQPSAEPTKTPSFSNEAAQSAKVPINADMKTGSQVFSEIFIDETRADLKLIENSVPNLAAGTASNNDKPLRDIKRACTSIYNASELFSFEKIASFTQFMIESTDQALTGEFDLTHTFVDLYQKVPTTIDGMILEKEDAIELSEAIKNKLQSVLSSLNSPDAGSDKANPPKENDGAKSSKTETSPNSGSETKTEAPMGAKENADSASEGNGNGKNFANVREAVDFVDKLL
ncbi:cell division protein FtsZ [bacterium]|nr:cell division protein FtsZ [bacterium]